MFCWNVGDWGVQNFIIRGFPRGSRRKGERLKMRDLGMVGGITTSCQFPINDYMVRDGWIDCSNTEKQCLNISFQGRIKLFYRLSFV